MRRSAPARPAGGTRVRDPWATLLPDRWEPLVDLAHLTVPAEPRCVGRQHELLPYSPGTPLPGPCRLDLLGRGLRIRVESAVEQASLLVQVIGADGQTAEPGLLARTALDLAAARGPHWFATSAGQRRHVAVVLTAQAAAPLGLTRLQLARPRQGPP